MFRRLFRSGSRVTSGWTGRAPSLASLSAELDGGSADGTHRYMHFHRYFHQRAPKWLRSHRRYFRSDNRGFGEDAFHAMWFAVLFDRRPKRLLEIGVYRGQILSLWALIARELGYSTEVVGVSPFSSVGDRVSVYKSIDYQKDVLQHFAHWNLSSPTLHRTLSTAPAAVDLIRGGEWDIVYVDGNHDYDVVREDLKNAVAGLRPGGIVVADDAALRLKYSPPPFAFQGHPGPSDGVRDLSEEGVVKLVTFVGHNVILSKK